jgi:hypothetical protein
LFVQKCSLEPIEDFKIFTKRMMVMNSPVKEDANEDGENLQPNLESQMI